MDQERFDRVARALGSAQSRRSALQTALAGVAAGVTAAFGVNAGDADAKSKKKKKKGNQGGNQPGNKRTVCVPETDAAACKNAKVDCGVVKNNCNQDVTCKCKNGGACDKNKCYCPKERDGECGPNKICCPAGQKCDGTKCYTPCVPESRDETCRKAGSVCGTVKNNCGQDVNCGTCPTGFNCKDNKTCVCPTGITCGDKCCPAGQTCEGGKCVSQCIPETDKQACDKAGSVCGTVKNNCGQDVNCGTCTNGFDCKDNKTCVCPSEKVCDGVCCESSDEVCNKDGGACCVPSVTVCPADTCGSIDDGCGQTIECSVCPGGSTCTNNICVPDQCKTVNQGCTDVNPCCANLICRNGVCDTPVEPACVPRGGDCTNNPCCNANDTCDSNASGSVNVCKQAPPNPNPKPKPNEPKCAKNGERPRNGAKCCGRLHENHGRCRTNRWERCNRADRREPNCGCDRSTRCKGDRRGGTSCQG